ncbi:hypothetical protein [Allokutzneria sp. NRRL B-24872]|uniref:hypothetical protein n=1 Tax=Allokutzneria sp. NRRL B-24872 TaxID=1137961 RepID=UPI00143D6126|nr:hypothetical protein [Allokutzneria sp. NRRL B-24872]
MSWNWHLTCAAGDAEIDVIASPDLEGFLLEDDSGRFEIEADASTLPDALAERLLS